MSERDQYIESLAADLYWAGELWFRRVDPYHADRPKWFALREDLKNPYRTMAQDLIEADQKVSA